MEGAQRELVAEPYSTPGAASSWQQLFAFLDIFLSSWDPQFLREPAHSQRAARLVPVRWHFDCPAVRSSPMDSAWRFFLPALLWFRLPAVSVRLHLSLQPLALGPVLHSAKACRAVPTPTGFFSSWVLLSPPTLSFSFATHSTFPDSALSPYLLRIPPPLPPTPKSWVLPACNLSLISCQCWSNDERFISC